MFGDQILAFRKAKGMTQEELAVKLHVVRQTVSKWEKGLSVPDAQMLTQLAKCLDVTVAQLLDVPPETSGQLNLAEELAKANEALVQLQQREAQIKHAGRIRNPDSVLLLFGPGSSSGGKTGNRFNYTRGSLHGDGSRHFISQFGAAHQFNHNRFQTEAAALHDSVQSCAFCRGCGGCRSLLSQSSPGIGAMGKITCHRHYHLCHGICRNNFAPSCPTTGIPGCAYLGRYRMRILGIWRTEFSVSFLFL